MTHEKQCNILIKRSPSASVVSGQQTLADQGLSPVPTSYVCPSRRVCEIYLRMQRSVNQSSMALPLRMHRDWQDGVELMQRFC